MGKKFYNNCVCFFVGLILGCFLVLIIGQYTIRKRNDSEIMLTISEIESLIISIQQNKEYESEIVLQKYLIEKIENYEENFQYSSRIDLLKIDKGFAHIRLYLIYRQLDENFLASQEYEKAFSLLKGRYKLKTKDDFKNIVNELERKQMRQTELSQ